ncbi:hypothetical protein AB4401_22310 [Vibrio cyclitrophicus]
MDISLLSSIPTDSLYKFMSISGLMILLSSLLIPFYFMNNYQMKYYDLKKTNDLTGLKVIMLIERITIGLAASGGKCKDFYTEHSHLNGFEFYNQFGPWLTIQKNAPDMREELVTLTSTLGDDFDDIIKQIRKEQIEIECETKKIELLYCQLDILQSVQKLGVFIGSVLTISGLILWYKKLQVFIDASIVAGG